MSVTIDANVSDETISEARRLHGRLCTQFDYTPDDIAVVVTDEETMELTIGDVDPAELRTNTALDEFSS